MRPRCLEYTGDKCCSMNEDKHLLGKITFYHGKGKRNGDKVTHPRVIDFYTADGKRFQDIQTVWGEGFVAFHHRLLSQELSEYSLPISPTGASNRGADRQTTICRC